MKTTNLIFILLISVLFSCQTRMQQQLEKDIVGEWTFTKTIDNRKPNKEDNYPSPPPVGKSTEGYIFYQNSNCENKSGYFITIERNERENRKTFYLGNKTKYKIEEDSLMIFDISDSTWESQKILSIVDDTLTIQNSDSIFSKFIRTKYKLNPKENYDKIIVSSSGCYGTCPIMDFSIDKNGDVLYFGEEFNTQNGLFTSKITKEEYQNIETAFKKADLNNLNENYQADWTDDETVTITFIKDSKIVQSITDYGRQAPTELIWAYTPIRYLYQKIKLEPFKPEIPILFLWRTSFETKQQICNLTKSESFYLLTEIYKGKEITHNFDEKYKIVFWNAKYKKEIIFTDGKLFKIKDKTIDIGYNYLIRNNLKTKFRNKNEYDK